MNLREYQILAKENIKKEFQKGNQRVVLQLPTGAGKTVVFTSIAKDVSNKGKKALVLTNRKELLTQAGSTFERFGLEPKYLTASTKAICDSGLYVAMVETLKRRLTKQDYIEFIQSFDLIIIDECHIASFDKLFMALSDKQFVIGATATPHREGKIKPLKDFYDSIVIGQQISELIQCDYLTQAVHYGTKMNGIEKIGIKMGDFDTQQMGKYYNDVVLFDGVVNNYNLHCSDKKALLFCATVENSKRMVYQFNTAGISAMHIDAETPKSEREQILREFKEGKYKVLSNVGILTTGYDEASIDVIIIYRATRSLPLWLQMCGRGSRLNEGKNEFIILDFGENARRLGKWDDDREWTLDIVKPPKKKGAPLVKECKSCGALISANSMICPHCGHEHIKQQKEKTPVEVILEKMTPSEIQKKKWNFLELEEIAKLKGYKTQWIWHRLGSLQNYIDYGKYKGYKSKWAYIQHEKYN